MIDVLVIGERVSADVINTIMDKSTHIAVRDCIIEGPGYLSNINSYVGISGCRFEDTVLVVKNDPSKTLVMDTKFNNCGVRPVNVVCGYAYTHQITCDHSYGVHF